MRGCARSCYLLYIAAPRLCVTPSDASISLENSSIAFIKIYARLKSIAHGKARTMEPKECFHKEQFGYCWLEGSQWMFQAVDVHEQPLGEPIRVELGELVFHDDEDEELH